MAEIAPLEAVGLSPHFFHLPPSMAEFEALTYYLVAGGQPGDFRIAEYWDILAVATLAHDPHALILRQIHIEEEELEFGDEHVEAGERVPEVQQSTLFDPWNECSSFALDPLKLAALQRFLLSLAERLPSSGSSSNRHAHFSPASPGAYVECGIPAGLVERFYPLLERDTLLYHYHPGSALAPACRFLQLSHWSSPHPRSATASFSLQTYTPARVAAIQHAYASYLKYQATHPWIEADIMDGESYLHLTKGALQALAHLLRERLDAVPGGGR